MTQKQISALRYAAGELAPFPSYGVAKRLADKGLIRWTGDIYRGFRLVVETSNENRGWVITDAGKRVLTNELDKP